MVFWVPYSFLGRVLRIPKSFLGFLIREDRPGAVSTLIRVWRELGLKGRTALTIPFKISSLFSVLINVVDVC